MKIAICDDVKEFREELKEYCARFAEEFQIEWQIVEYTSGEELLCNFSSDVLLLDIEMAGIDGLQVKNALQRENVDTRILFVSSHEEVIPEAFGRNVYGFLCKPLEYEMFHKKMRLVLEDILEQSKYMILDDGKSVRKVFVRDIYYVKSDGKYCRLFFKEKEDYFFSDDSITEWSKKLEEYGFAFCHRSHLVNLAYIKKIDKEVILQNDERVPLSRRLAKEFYAIYKEYVWRKAK